MKRVGIYSGTFDPVHVGHITLAREALEQCGLDKVFFLVEPRPRRKQGVKALEHRYEMVKLAIKQDSNFGSILLNQQRFTAVGTLPVLQERFRGAELYMVMGDDMLGHFADWPHVEELVHELKFAIGIRRHTRAEILQKLSIIEQTRGFVMKYALFQSPQAEFSSSKIRHAIKNGNFPNGLTEEVSEYIGRQGLYSVAGSS